MPAPVDFSDLSSEYVGILYEGLLDFELKTAPAGDPVIFLAVGNQPALPLSRLEEMDDKALKDLLEKMKDTSSSDEEAGEGEDDTEEWASEDGEGTDDEFDAEDPGDVDVEAEAPGPRRLKTIATRRAPGRRFGRVARWRSGASFASPVAGSRLKRSSRSRSPRPARLASS